jgi:predicted TPR repeat methyltransferase
MTRRQSCTEYWLDTQTGTFRGDFEGMYQDIDDPWGCEASKSSLNNRLFEEIIFYDTKRFERILDIGCGLGGLLNSLRNRNGGGYVLGIDVSATAVSKAKVRYPELNFERRDVVKEKPSEGNFDLVILSEVLWYVLDDLGLFFDTVASLLSVSGRLAVHQYFPAEQRYGTDRIDGLQGFLRFMEARTDLTRQHTYTNHHHDGLVLLSTFRKER